LQIRGETVEKPASTAALRSSLMWLAREHFKFTLPKVPGAEKR
jgi:hypothetical protein